jgi:hypothetical protein
MSVTKPPLRSEAKFSIGLQLLTYPRLPFAPSLSIVGPGVQWLT